MTQTSELVNMSCQNYPSGTPAMTPESVLGYMSQVPGWALSDDGKELRKTYRFNDFMNGLTLVNRIAEVAEAEDHHPDILLGWGKVEVMFTTHSIGGLSLNDLICAAKVDRLAADAPGRRS